MDPLDASGVGAASRTPLPLPPIQSVTAASRTSDYRGWQTVDSALARFMLPATYQVIDLGTGFSELFGAFAQGFVEGMGEFAEGMSEALQTTPTPLSLTGLDKALQFDFVLALEPATQASALLVSEPLPEPRSLELSLHDALASMEGELQVICIELVQGAALPTGRILVDTRDPETGESGRALVWVFLQPDRRWNLIFQAPRASFDSNLESFETSGASFELR